MISILRNKYFFEKPIDQDIHPGRRMKGISIPKFSLVLSFKTDQARNDKKAETDF